MQFHCWCCWMDSANVVKQWATARLPAFCSRNPGPPGASVPLDADSREAASEATDTKPHTGWRTMAHTENRESRNTVKATACETDLV